MKIKEFESAICANLKKNHRLNIELACFATEYIPKHILLDKTRNIHSYLIFCQNNNGKLSSTYWNEDTINTGLINIVKTQYSQLDRPLFFIIQNTDNTLNIIEGNLIREKLQEGSNDKLTDFILNQSDFFQDVLPKIKKEL